MEEDQQDLENHENDEDDMEIQTNDIRNDESQEKSNECEKSERLLKFPLAKIKHIIKIDPDVNITSQDAAIMMAKAAVG